MSNPDALQELDLAIGSDGVELGQDFSGVGGQGDQDGQVGQAQQSNVGLRVRPELGLGHQVDGILLSLEPRWNEVSIPHKLGVINTEN